MMSLLIGKRSFDRRCQKELCDDFQKEFQVDLRSDKYANGKLEDKWELLIRDCTVSKSKENWSEYIHLFEEKLFDLIDRNRTRLKINGYVIHKDSESEEEILKQNKEEFIRCIKQYIALIDNYWLYEADVWLNSRLVLKYQDCLELEKKNKCSGNITGGDVLDDKNEKHRLPFEDDEEGYFCAGLLNRAIGKKGCLFWTELGEGESINIQNCGEQDGIEEGNLHRADIKLKLGKVYNSFGYRRIQKFEQDMGIEDKTLFHKTVNGVLLRNMVNKMYDDSKSFEVENYVDLVDKLCGCKSLIWQNLIGCFYVLLDKYKVELNMLDFYEDVEMIILVWLDHIKKINYHLRILTEGFIYLYEKNEHNEVLFEKRCKEFLSNLELEIDDSIRDYWEKQSDKLKVHTSVLENHNGYCWIYAILQRRTIDTIKNLYRDGGFIEDPMRTKLFEKCEQVSGDVSLPNKIVSADHFQVNIKRAVEEITKQRKQKQEGNGFN